MEGYCFPFKTTNLNYDNLKYYFDLLQREYITSNGILLDNTIDTKLHIENKIDIFAKLSDNPLSVFNDDFSIKFVNTPYNLEEQFFINRIAFMKFKRYGAILTFDEIYEALKILQTSTFEEKLRLILNLIDIYDNKLLLKTEMEKLLVFTAIQNYESSNRINHVIDELYGKNTLMKYEDVFNYCLKESNVHEAIREVLQE